MNEHRDYLKGRAKRWLETRKHPDIDPSELVQETFLRAHTRIEQYQGTSEPSLRAWLRTVMRRLFLDRVRRSRLDYEPPTSPSGDVEALPCSRSSPSKVVMKAEHDRRLREAVDRLPKDQATAIRLHYFEGLTVVETAQRMNRPRDAVAGLVRRGLAALRREIGRGSEEAPP